MTQDEWRRRATERTVVEDLGDPPTTARWLAWATAVLLIIGVVSAGVMNLSGDGSEDGVVTAASRSAGEVDLTSTTTLPPVPPSAVQRPAPTSTTVPKAAAAVLKALGTTAPPTTQPPATTSTTAAPVATTLSTTTTVPPRATVSVRNDLTRPFLVKLNGVPVAVEPGKQSAGVPLDLRQTPDAIEGDAVGEPPCEVGAVGDLFRPGLTYLVSVVASQTACAGLTVTVI